MKIFALATLLPAVSAESFAILRSIDGSEISLEKAPGEIVSPAKLVVPTGCDRATARPVRHDDGTYALQLDLGTCSGDKSTNVQVEYSTVTVKAPPTPAPTAMPTAAPTQAPTAAPTAAPTQAPLTFRLVSNKNCEGGGAVGYGTPDCRKGTRPNCSGDKYKCYNSDGAGYYNWKWGRCWFKTFEQAKAVCNKYRNGLNGFKTCHAIGKDGGGFEPRICTKLKHWSGMHSYMVTNNGKLNFPGY